MMLYLTIAILAGFALMDYISYRRGGLLYITGDSLAVNRLALDVKIKIVSINHVDIIIDKKKNTARYSITTHNGTNFKTAKTKVGSDRYNHAGKLLMKCGVNKFRTVDK